MRPDASEVPAGIVRDKMRALYTTEQGETSSTSRRRANSSGETTHRVQQLKYATLSKMSSQPYTDELHQYESKHHHNSPSSIQNTSGVPKYIAQLKHHPSNTNGTTVHVRSSSVQPKDEIQHQETAMVAERQSLRPMHDDNGFHFSNGAAATHDRNVDMLLNELDAAKDLNKKLSTQLARTERDLQSIKIQQSLQDDKIEATVASRIADAVLRMNLTSTQNGGAPDSSGAHSMVSPLSVSASDSTHETLHHAHNGHPTSTHNRSISGCGVDTSSVVTPSQMQHRTDMVVSYIQKHGDCTVPGAASRQRASTAGSDEKQPTRLQLEQAIDQMCAEREHWEKKNSDLQAQLGNAETELNVMRAKLRERSPKHDSSIQINKMKADFEKQRNEWMRERAELLIKAASAAKLEKPAKLTDIAELQLKYDELHRDFERELQEKEEIILQLNTVAQRLAEYETQSPYDLAHNNTVMMLTGDNAEIQRLEKQVQQLKHDLHSRSSAVEHNETLSKLESAERAVARMQKQLADNDREFEVLKKEKRENEEARQKLADERTRVLEALEDNRKALRESQLKLESATLLHEQDTNALKRERATVTDTTDQLRRRIDELEIELEEKTSELATVSRKTDSQTSRVEQLEQENRELRETARQATQDVKQLKLELKESTASAQASNELQQLERDLADAKRKNEKLQCDMKSLREERDKLYMEHDKLKRQYKQLDDENAELEEKLDEQKYTHAANSNSQTTSTDLKHALEEKQRLSEQLAEAHSKHESAKERWNHEMYELQRKYEEADGDVYEMKQQILKLKNQLEQATPTTTPRSPEDQVKYEELKEELKLTAKENKRVNDELQKTQRLVNVLRRKLAQATGQA